MNQERIRSFVQQGKSLGVKEFYFTGGEPFLNKEIYGILADTLAIGPVTVLTNGTTIRKRVAKKLKDISDATIYSLELRVSLDGFDAQSNDRLRGAGSFDSALKGITSLADAGFLPIITAVQTWPDSEHPAVLGGFRSLLMEIGYSRPRIKVIPALNLGGYKNMRTDTAQEFLVTEQMLEGFDQNQLICANSRLVTDQGVYVCPILLDSPDANLGDSLAESMRPYALKHKACYTCYRWGAICSNFSTSASEGQRLLRNK